MKNQKTVWASKTESGKSVKVCKLDKASFGYKWMVDSETGYPAQHFKTEKTAIEFALNMLATYDKYYLYRECNYLELTEKQIQEKIKSLQSFQWEDGVTGKEGK